MLTREIVSDGHVTRFTVTRGPQGWDVREERDTTIVKRLHLEDWHRVERAIHAFEQSQSDSSDRTD
jgi:hypothetical protein